jgi:hypothetical protein
MTSDKQHVEFQDYFSKRAICNIYRNVRHIVVADEMTKRYSLMSLSAPPLPELLCGEAFRLRML